MNQIQECAFYLDTDNLECFYIWKTMNWGATKKKHYPGFIDLDWWYLSVHCLETVSLAM